MNFEQTALLLAWLAIALLGLAMAGLVRQFHLFAAGQGLNVRPVGPPIGSRMPAVAGTSVGRPAVVLFADTDCATCAEILPHFRAYADRLTRWSFVAVYPGSSAADEAGRMVAVRGARDLFSELAVAVTPFLVLVDADGYVTDSRAVGSVEALHAMFTPIMERAIVP